MLGAYDILESEWAEGLPESSFNVECGRKIGFRDDDRYGLVGDL